MSPKPASPVPQAIAVDELNRLVAGHHDSPHSVLGPHPHGGGITIRTLRPMAKSVTIVSGPDAVAMSHEHEGVWVGVLGQKDVGDYRLEVEYETGGTHTYDDPYRFLPTVRELDQHLISEGRHEQLWTVLGAHIHRYAGATAPVVGTSFAVWAPNAKGVRVAGDFNFWDGRAHPMRQLGATGVWELFVPDIGKGTLYKYEVCGADGVWRQKADPLAMQTQTPPERASVVFESEYEWGDQSWIDARPARPTEEPMSLYEVHLGSWRAGRTYEQLADELVDYVAGLGFTHVELLPVMEHPFGGSWGYQVSSYFAPTARFGDPDGLRLLIDRLHQAGIGVILDWVPAHFPKDDWALARFDGTALYEHADPARGEHPEWGTYIFDFGRNEVRNFLVANAVFWLEEYHVDGLRVVAVASMLYLDYSRDDGQWTPNIYGGRENLEAVSFLQEVNATTYKRVPGVITIAEESTAWPGVTRPTHVGGLGFGFKWNMGWMHDSLAYMSRDPIHRQYHHHQMTFAMMYAYTENYVLPLSHDEVVHGKGSLLRKMPGDRWRQLANLRAYLAYMWAHPGKQLIFMGIEMAQESEWAESRELDWWLLDHIEHRGVHDLVADLNRTYRANEALWSLDQEGGGFSWIDANDSTSNVFSFLRIGKDGSQVACISNFSAVPHHDYRLGLPASGEWTEILNTDAEVYYGSGVGNLGTVIATDEQWHGRPSSAVVQLPPLASVWFRHTAKKAATER
ncbi:MAG TPA: 1,4-alpha-glucan branching protein GlgB [Nocardioidaceae bacterium]|nr:1,4-alpha-glucan branching protein GlgB [Nocardioidaceae bacterium]